MRNKLINELKKLNVKNDDALNRYVDFCLEHNQKHHIKFKTAHHHILPKAKSMPFSEYKNLKEHPWNGTYLLYKDHYIAHYLLVYAVDEIASSRSFLAMKYQEPKLGRVDENEMINAESYDELLKDHLNKYSNLMKEIMPDRMKDVYKNRDKKYRTDKAEKAAQTKKENGIFEQVAKQHKKYQNEIMDSGLTRAQETGLKTSQTRKKKFESGELIRQTGSKNSQAIEVFIFNEKHDIMFKCNGDFEKICKENGLPRSYLKRSYATNDRTGFKKTPRMLDSYYDMYRMYEGWYAVKIENKGI